MKLDIVRDPPDGGTVNIYRVFLVSKGEEPNSYFEINCGNGSCRCVFWEPHADLGRHVEMFSVQPTCTFYYQSPTSYKFANV